MYKGKRRIIPHINIWSNIQIKAKTIDLLHLMFEHFYSFFLIYDTIFSFISVS